MLQKCTTHKSTDNRSDTPHRIMEAAGEIFSDSGYRHTTIRAICEKACVNVAAINYHFGGKKNLYLTVLNHWRSKAFEKYHFDPTDISTAGPRERLGVFVRTLLFRVLDEGDGSRFAKLMAQEFINPTSGFDVIMDETLKPFYSFLSTTVKQLLPVTSNDDTINLCCLSIAGQIFHLYMGRHVMRKIMDRDNLSPDEIEMVARHITQFSLDAIDAIAVRCQGVHQ
jgi:TetR/AcrR family transcriptional regulator, regulator of cefoperazone and chloramphenicol sensitivity